MPYIAKESRETVTPSFDRPVVTAGELNYQITCLLQAYIKHWAPPSYQRINDALGALEGAKLEFYRRVAVPYENTKIEENGDVY